MGDNYLRPISNGQYIFLPTFLFNINNLILRNKYCRKRSTYNKHENHYILASDWWNVSHDIGPIKQDVSTGIRNKE
jgi:hypothetical protein